MTENNSGIVTSGIQPMEDAMRKKIDSLTTRAKAHGIDLTGGKSNVVVVEMLLDRLDAYRDTPSYKGRILID